MPSVLKGFEYDIFISYRQKDNKQDGWVTRFVHDLKGELDSTFKQEISVYFDVNPHDGLLETHDVHASLKEKLKCLIFIPVISRTYCDPKSFAWEHEFLAFIEQASHDKFGLKVKLPGGNVANRVLPVRIHDLDSEDKALLEGALGGILRPVDFIYSEPGVNRPLTPEDEEKKNLTHTRYRNQINKVGNAIREIISGLKAEPAGDVKDEKSVKKVKREKNGGAGKQAVKGLLSKILAGVLLVALVIAALVIAPKIFGRDKFKNLKDPDGRVSVAVMPFKNLTNDTIWNVWEEGIQNELITDLSNYTELRVKQIESVTGALKTSDPAENTSFTPAIASSVSQKLGANMVVYGSIKEAGKTIRFNAQLIDAATQEPFKSFQLDGSAESEILPSIDSLKGMIRNFVLISVLKKGLTYEMQKFATTNSAEAYRYFIYGKDAFFKWDLANSKSWLLKALEKDPNFSSAILYLSESYGNEGDFPEAKKWAVELYKRRDQLPLPQKIAANWLYAENFEPLTESIKYCRQYLEVDDQMPVFHFELGFELQSMEEYAQAILPLEKSLEIYKKWGTAPPWLLSYTILAGCYHETKQYKKEEQLYKDTEVYFPDKTSILKRRASLALCMGDTASASRLIEKYLAKLRLNSTNEADIAYNMAEIYAGTNLNDETEKYYRKALNLASDKSFAQGNLAWFLIDKNRNIDEGLELIDKVLQTSPDVNSAALDTKGWGLYKKGRYKEALVFLEKARDMSPRYYHDAWKHIAAVKKAMAK